MALLSDLPVLIIDCQATGPAAAGGHLLEIGWVRTTARTAVDITADRVFSFLVSLPQGGSIPRKVQRITGIGSGQTSAAPLPVEAWRKMRSAEKSPAVPTVIHYARFELPFLRRLHAEAADAGPFPLEIACTHEIVRRLLPQLPRKGLRAVAGFFNHGVGEHRRCAGHVAATARIWHHLCRLLAEKEGLTTFFELRQWLQQTPIPAASRSYPMDRARLDTVPDKPGVYRMRRQTGDLLYIGKAVSLRRRVASYFRPRARHPEHILEMLTQARDLEFSQTDTALTAAVKEADEIRRSSPPYNRALRTEGRSLAFVSADFTRSGAMPTGACRIGPLPGERIATALCALARICSRSSWLSGEILSAMDLSPDRMPKDKTIKEGIDAFLSRHGSVLLAGPAARAMMKTARALWLEKMAVAANGQRGQEKDDDTVTPEPGEPEWTPERVAGRLEGSLCHGGRMIRRARWFAILSESSLSWSPASEKRRGRNAVVIHCGSLHDAGPLSAGNIPPLPPGCRTPASLRRAQIDLAAYQRLRVMTTEIRRLLAEGRHPVLRISKRVILGPARLSRVLFWM